MLRTCNGHQSRCIPHPLKDVGCGPTWAAGLPALPTAHHPSSLQLACLLLAGHVLLPVAAALTATALEPARNRGAGTKEKDTSGPRIEGYQTATRHPPPKLLPFCTAPRANGSCA